MTLNVNYHSNYSLPLRFASHFALGVKENIGPRDKTPKNLCEKVGDIYLWTIEHLPRHIWNGFKDPRIATIALTSLALIATSFTFYPTITVLMIKTLIIAIPFPQLLAIKFALYLYICGLIVSTALRAEGRFTNTQLMNQFYNPTNSPE